MSLREIFKKSFIQGFSRYDMSPTNIAIIFAISTIFALYIFLAYRLLTRKTLYSKSFNISLPVVTLTTTGLILAIQSSVVISLGMVGALSIVRLRTAIKDPMDLAFLFWAISTGIICGAGFAEIASILAIVVTIMIFGLDRIPVGKAPLILMAELNDITGEEKICAIIRKHGAYRVKSRIVKENKEKLIIQIRTFKFFEQKILQEIASLDFVIEASLLAHDGEITY